MSTPYVGQISMFAGNYAPYGWALCNGQLLPIPQYQALFVLLGTYYGGNGINTFALPDLQSRLPVHWGTGTGLSTYVIGESGGTSAVTLLPGNVPQHTHTLNATPALANSFSIGSGFLPAAVSGTNAPLFYAQPVAGHPDPTPVAMAPGACSTTGSGLAHDNMMPSLCISFIIAMQGLFPTRN